MSGPGADVQDDVIANEGDRLLMMWASWLNTGVVAGSRSLPKTPCYMRERVDNDHGQLNDAEHPIAQEVESVLVILKTLNRRAYNVIADYYLHDRNCRQISSSRRLTTYKVKDLLRCGRHYVAGALAGKTC